MIYRLPGNIIFPYIKRDVDEHAIRCHAMPVILPFTSSFHHLWLVHPCAKHLIKWLHTQGTRNHEIVFPYHHITYIICSQFPALYGEVPLKHGEFPRNAGEISFINIFFFRWQIIWSHTLFWTCDYLFMLRIKLTLVSERPPGSLLLLLILFNREYGMNE